MREHLTPFNMYVTLSRAQGRNRVRLVRDFEDSLFTMMPCEVLEREDEQLGEMHRKTKEEWEERMRGM